jgi:hypothetical protein
VNPVEGGVDPILPPAPSMLPALPVLPVLPVFPVVLVELPLVPPALPVCAVPPSVVFVGEPVLPVCPADPVPGATAPWFVPVPVDTPAVLASPPPPPPQAASKTHMEDVVSVLEIRNIALPINEGRMLPFNVVVCFNYMNGSGPTFEKG